MRARGFAGEVEWLGVDARQQESRWWLVGRLTSPGASQAAARVARRRPVRRDRVRQGAGHLGAGSRVWRLTSGRRSRSTGRSRSAAWSGPARQKTVPPGPCRQSRRHEPLATPTMVRDDEQLRRSRARRADGSTRWPPCTPANPTAIEPQAPRPAFQRRVEAKSPRSNCWAHEQRVAAFVPGDRDLQSLRCGGDRDTATRVAGDDTTARSAHRRGDARRDRADRI